MGEALRIRNEADLAIGLDALIGVDPRLEVIAREAGPLPLRLTVPGFEGLAFIVVSQMVSRASADAIWRRLCTGMGTPEPSSYLALGDEALALGLSRAKHACLSGLASAVVNGEFDPLAVLDKPVEAALADLVRLKGIGLWTAEVYLMFCGGHADVFPAGDVALRAAVGQGLGLAVRPDIRQTAEIALAWRPYRAIAARLFWALYAVRLRRDVAPAPV